MRLRVAILLMLFIGICLDHGAPVLADETWALRKSRREVEELLRGRDRIVDFGIVLKVVNKDPNGEELLPGRPHLRVLREHTFGFRYDTLERRPISKTYEPVEWMCSEDQEPLLLHPDSMPGAIWFQGSMGVGKTHVGGMWGAIRTIRHAMHDIAGGAGVTAPTDDRMEPIRAMLFGPKRDGKRIGGLWPKSWYSWSEGSGTCVFATDLQIDFRTAGLSNAEIGSPFQGYNWPAWLWNDELQDYYKLDGDLRMRMRGAWRGRPLRFATVTPKDDPGYRTFRGKVETSPNWHRAFVALPRSPFIHQSELDEYAAEMNPREYQRKVLGLDVASERALYPTFCRVTLDGKPGNLRPIPDLGAEDVTREVLAPYGDNLSILVGHDPGKRQDVSVLLKAYRIGDSKKHVWFVIDEVITTGTTEQHVVALLKRLREKYRCNEINREGQPVGRQAFVRADPYSDSARGDKQPDKSVYTVFRDAKIYIRAAAYADPSPNSTKAPKPGTVPKEGRIDMVARLFCDAFGTRRLFIACDDRQQPLAPGAVESAERSERDEAYEAEADKGTSDVSHHMAAVGYALWMLEKPRVGALGGGAA
jgi:hypothetical protein